MLSLAVDALLEVLDAGPVVERRVAERGEPLVDLGAERVVDREPVGARRLPEQGVVEAVEAPQLLDRALVVVDAEVDEGVGQPGVAAVALDDEQRGRLLAAAVAAGCLRRGEAVEQPLGERSPGGGRERVDERVDRLRRDEDVALGRVAVAGPPAGPVVALGAGERRAAPGRVDDAELALLAAVVGRRQPLDDLVGRGAAAEELEAVRPVARVRVGLGRDRADVRRRPRHDRADGEELRLRRDAPLAGVEVAGADRVRRDDGGRSSAIGEIGEVEGEEALVGDEHAGDLGPRERRRDLLDRGGADDDGHAVGVGGAQRLDVARRRRAERAREVDRAGERELGDLATRAPEPALAAGHSAIVSPGGRREELDAGGEQLAERLGRAGEQRERRVVARRRRGGRRGARPRPPPRAGPS